MLEETSNRIVTEKIYISEIYAPVESDMARKYFYTFIDNHLFNKKLPVGRR